MDNVIEATTSYSVGALAMCIDWHQFGSEVAFWGGLIVVAARLIVDVPRAYRSIKSRWKGE